MLTMTDLKPGKKIMHEWDPYDIVKYEHHAMWRWSSVVNITMKNLKTWNLLTTTFRSNDKLEEADITYSNVEFLYIDWEEYIFMNTETYDQFWIRKDVIWDDKFFLIEWQSLIIQELDWYPLNVQLEPSVILEVEETPPGEKWDTATWGKKPATLITWLVVQVPLFIKPWDKIKVDTRTREYLSRA